MALLVLVLSIGAACAFSAPVIAVRRGWSTVSAALAGFILGPLGTLIAAASPVQKEVLDDERVRAGDARRCLACRTVVSLNANRPVVCREELPPPRATL